MIRLLLIFVSFGPAALGQIIVQHTGASQPSVWDWERVAQGSSVIESSLINDIGSGLDAWAIDDRSTGADFAYYRHALSTNELQLINQHGWRLKVLVRVVDFPTSTAGASSTNNSIAVLLRAGELGRDFDLFLGSGMSDGAPSIIANNIYHGVDGYAEITVEYSPAFGEWGESSLEMRINGVTRMAGSRLPPNGSGPAYIAWGCFGGATIGHGAWHEVTLEALPPVEEPAIKHIEFSSSDICLDVAGVRRGVYYVVERAVDISQPDWTWAMGFRPSTSGPTRICIDRDTEPAAFYRVRSK